MGGSATGAVAALAPPLRVVRRLAGLSAAAAAAEAERRLRLELLDAAAVLREDMVRLVAGGETYLVFASALLAL